MGKDPQEWLRQADYDMATSEYMYTGGRYIYAVFMCHLALEKALKGIYQKETRKHSAKNAQSSLLDGENTSSALG